MTVGQQAPATRVRAAGWMWGVGVGLCVALVLAGAYVGRHVAASRASAGAHIGPPSVPLTAVVRELRPEAGAAFAVPIGTSTRMVLVASSAERSCPPVGACGPVPRLDQIEIADIATGSVVATQTLTGPAQQALAIAVDPQLGLVSLVAPSEITTYAVSTLDATGSWPLPAGMAADQSSGAAVGANGALWLTASQGGQRVLLGMDHQSGAVRAHVALAGAASTDGPLYDAADDTLLVLERSAAGSALAVFSASGGALARTVTVPAGARLGPLDPTTHTVYLYGADGTTYGLDLHPGATDSGPAAVPALFGARALGWDASSEQVYVADDAGVRIAQGSSGVTRSALPVTVASPPQQALAPVDAGGEHLLPLLAEHGTLLVLGTSPRSAGGMTAGTAALVARAAYMQLVPQDVGDATPQDPLFLTAAMFSPGPGVRASVPFMVRDPDVGWQSAAPGTTSVSVAAAAGGAYEVTFTVTWTQHAFTHRHVSVLRVASDGSVTRVSDAGDALP